MKLSFVLPSFNCVTFLPHAVTSALQQTIKDIEVIIVDDASTDRTCEYLAWLKNKDKRIKIVRNEVNRGRSESRNIGNALATGDIIAVLDADDLATPNRAELTLKKFRTSNPDFIYGQATVIDVLGRPQYVLGSDTIDKEFILDEKKNPNIYTRIVHSTVTYTKDFATKYPYEIGDAARLGVDDWSQQVKALLGGIKLDFINQRLACYRQLDSQISKSRNTEEVMAFKKKYIESIKVPA